MSILDELDKLRTRPETERQRLALWFSLLVTLILAVLWAWNLQFLNSTSPTPPAKAGPSFWSGLGEVWNNNVSRIQLGWQTITNQKK